LFLTSCVSRSAQIGEGIQPKFLAINPSRILAVPLFVVPDPAQKASVDLIAFETDKISTLIETEVLKDFSNQPSVNGVSFNRVRQLVGSDSKLFQQMSAELNDASKKISSSDPKDKLDLTEQCLKRKTVLEYYSFCLKDKKSWKENLNALSAKVLNADTALLVLLNSLEKGSIKDKYLIKASVTVVLVDTNSGALIWGKQAVKSIPGKSAQQAFSSWTELFAPLFDDEFWREFPGRKMDLPVTK
jgi:hypothetical protein